MIVQNKTFSTLTQWHLKFLQLLVQEGVRFVVVGGYAVRYHGYLRQPRDLDLFIDFSPQNVRLIGRVMQQLGFDDVNQICEHLLQPEKKLMFYDVEIFTSMDGLDFAEVFADCLIVNSNSVEIPVMSKPHLLRAKKLALEDPRRSSQAAQDAEDLDMMTRLTIQRI